MTSPARRTLSHLLRDLAPQVLGGVMRRCRDFADAEDAVQDALFAAATQWPIDGIPQNPRGWLYQTALRRLTDQARSNSARREREAVVARESPVATESEPMVADGIMFGGDDTLVLLFMCCHPSLSEPTAIALTLRAVGGLTTREIASAFLVPESTMAQRISRARQTIASSAVSFEMPSAAERAHRLTSVLRVLYLIFNEGYASSSGADVHRVELATEAIRLTRALHHLLPDDAEVAGLLALMRLTDARRDARVGPHGELIPLDEQDRTRWHSEAIAEGIALVSAALRLGRIGAYQLQAAIAAIHDEAATMAETDWPQILAFYEVLADIEDNPIVLLNRAVAIAMVRGPAAGLAAIDALGSDPRIQAHHRIDAVRGHLYAMTGDAQRAAIHLQQAAARTSSMPERNYLLAKAVRLLAARALTAS